MNSLINNVFGLIGLIILSPILLLLLLIAIVVTIIALPFIAVGICIAICIGDKNTPSFSPSVIDDLSIKLNEVETAHGKKLELNENKLTNVAMLMQKLQKMTEESPDKLSKSEINKIKREVEHEIKDLKDEAKSTLTGTEYKAMKKALGQEVKALTKFALFRENTQQKSMAPSVAQPV